MLEMESAYRYSKISGKCGRRWHGGTLGELATARRVLMKEANLWVANFCTPIVGFHSTPSYKMIAFLIDCYAMCLYLKINFCG